VQVIAALEPGLEREFGAERLLRVPVPPDRYIRVSSYPLAEIERAQILEHLLHECLVDEFNAIIGGGLHRRQTREDPHERRQRGAIALRRLTEWKLHVVRIEQAIAADPILQRQRLGLELDPVAAGELRADIEVRGGVEIRVPELEHDLRITCREAVFVGNPPPQDESVVVEPEVRRVQEHHLAELRLQHNPLCQHPDAELRGRPRDEVAVFEKHLRGREAIRLEDQLAFEILDFIEGTAVAVDCLGLQCRRRRLRAPRFTPGHAASLKSWGPAGLHAIDPVAVHDAHRRASSVPFVMHSFQAACTRVTTHAARAANASQFSHTPSPKMSARTAHAPSAQSSAGLAPSRIVRIARAAKTAAEGAPARDQRNGSRGWRRDPARTADPRGVRTRRAGATSRLQFPPSAGARFSPAFRGCGRDGRQPEMIRARGIQANRPFVSQRKVNARFTLQNRVAALRGFGFPLPCPTPRIDPLPGRHFDRRTTKHGQRS
jgi:hypothetical protein